MARVADRPERVEALVFARPARAFEAAGLRPRKRKGLNEVGLGVVRRPGGFQADRGRLPDGLVSEVPRVRRAAGRQARVLNRIVEDLFHQEGLKEERLRELIGHTPIEVIAGALLGVLVAIVMLGG